MNVCKYFFRYTVNYDFVQIENNGHFAVIVILDKNFICKNLILTNLLRSLQFSLFQYYVVYK